MTAGRLYGASDRLLEITTAELPEADPLRGLVSVTDAVEANVRTGRPAGKVEASLGRFRACAHQAPTDAGRSLLAL